MFKKKKKISDEEKFLETLVDYIQKAKQLKHSERDIMGKFIEQGYPNDLIMKAFELNLNQEVIMAKKEEEQEEEEEFEEDEDNEEEEDEEKEEEKEEVKPKKKKVKTIKPEEKGPSLQEVLGNHEQRLQAMEAQFFRLKSL